MERIPFAFTIVVFALLFTFAEKGNAGWGKQHFVFGNSNYTFHGNSARTLNWEESNKHCKETGSQLVSIESKKEWEFLKNKIQSMTTEEYYIGLKKDSKSREWRWISDNSKVNATIGEFPWARGEPSGDGKCAVMFKNYRQDHGQFNDLPCFDKKRGYICEISGFADSTGQEATTVGQTSLAVTSAARLTTPSKSPSTQAKSTGKGEQHFVFGNSKYTFHRNSAGTLNWEESNKHCKETGSQLVSIESKKEWEFLKNTIQSMATLEYFIGLKSDSESEEWRWISDDSKVNAIKGEFPWAKGEPSGDGNCAVMYKRFARHTGKFNDLDCGQKRPHICESSAQSTGQKGKGEQHLVFGNSKYTFHGNSAETLNWEESNQHCKETGSQLVSIESKKEWEFLKNTIQCFSTLEYFIGLKSDSESKEWRWLSNNSKVNATQGEFPWAKREPSGDGNCAVMYKEYAGNIGRFNDLDCAHQRPHICERSVDSTGQEATTMGLTSLAVTSAARLTTPSKSASTEAKSTGTK